VQAELVRTEAARGASAKLIDTFRRKSQKASYTFTVTS
jgi:hypothetical protein